MTTERRARPILFTGPMVLAILAGHKTQTRRVAKFPSWVNEVQRVGPFFHGLGEHPSHDCEESKCHHAYGKSMFTITVRHHVGTRLWVRETFMTQGADVRGRMMRAGKIPPEIIYRADDTEYTRSLGGMFKWQPAIFMPRIFSRINIEVTDVRVQRLQDITEEEAIAEGLTEGFLTETNGLYWQSGQTMIDQRHPLFDPKVAINRARGNFGMVWEKINGKKHPWAKNPWVFAYTFRRIH